MWGFFDAIFEQKEYGEAYVMERVSRETVDYLRELARAGARLHGASDPKFETINVLAES